MQLFKFFKEIFLHFQLLASNTIKMKVFVYISGTIVIRNRTMVWKNRWYLLIFSLELEIFGVAIHRIHQDSEKL